MDDHFLQSAAAFGFWFSRPGNGISHVVHGTFWQRQNTLGSDSHTPAGGGIGMLAGTGGLDVALAAAGEPYYVKMPKLWASN
jgi:aconitate hydratase